MYRLLIFALISLLSTGCAYRFGLSERALPGGYTQVAIPVFKNKSSDVGIESYFTNALVRRFARSQVARVTDKESSPLLLLGTIDSVEVISGPAQTKADFEKLPDQAVITTEYRVIVNTHLQLMRRSDEKILWEGNFTNQKAYYPPHIGGAVVNSANATYNQSVRLENINRMADEMMAEAHDRMTENF